jgi:hypothetical protein
MVLISRRSLLVGGATLAMGAPRARGRGDPLAGTPAPIKDQGYRLAFEEDFDALDIGETGHRWAPRLWYDRPPVPGACSARDSVLSLKSVRSGGVWRDCAITSEWTDTRGGTFFRGGYFEARMKVPRGWPSFWLFSVNHTRNVTKTVARPDTLCAEIDVFEGDSAHPRLFCGAVHRNTSGQGGVPDAYNHNNCHDVALDLTQDWHLYGALWTAREIVWYLDRVETHRSPAFDSTWQYAFIIFGIAARGVLGGPPPKPETSELELLVDWVRVWNKPMA